MSERIAPVLEDLQRNPQIANVLHKVIEHTGVSSLEACFAALRLPEQDRGSDIDALHGMLKIIKEMQAGKDPAWLALRLIVAYGRETSRKQMFELCDSVIRCV